MNMIINNTLIKFNYKLNLKILNVIRNMLKIVTATNPNIKYFIIISPIVESLFSKFLVFSIQ